MEQSEKKIPLNFKRKYFEEIYFNDNKGNIFLSPLIKKEFIYTVIALLLLIGSVLYAYIDAGKSWLIVLLLVALVFLLINYYIKAMHIYRWKTSVIDFINANEKFASHSLVLTDTAICLVQDGREAIYKWSEITSAVVDPDYIALSGPEGFIFPRKSMSEENYQYLCEKIKQKVKYGKSVV